MNYGAILLSLLKGLTLCDHMGDVSNEVASTLEAMGLGNLVGDDWATVRVMLEQIELRDDNHG